MVLGGLCAFPQAWYPEGSVPKSGDGTGRSLQKINQLLYDGGTAGGGAGPAWFPEGSLPAQGDDSVRSLQKINQILYNTGGSTTGGGTGQTNITDSTTNSLARGIISANGFVATNSLYLPGLTAGSYARIDSNGYLTNSTRLTPVGASNVSVLGTFLSDSISTTNNINLNALTASRALVSDGSKYITNSAVTSTELGYVSGVTSAIQTQLNSKGASDNWTAVGTTNSSLVGTATINDLIATNGVKFPGLTLGAFLKIDSTTGYVTNVTRLSTVGTTNISLTGQLFADSINLTNGLIFAAGAGAITHIAGPSDQPLKITATVPVQASASVAGNGLTLNAANATAGSSSAGAAAGGSVTITAGNAARLTSGSASGGNVSISGGNGVGGSGGSVSISGGNGTVAGDAGGSLTLTSGNTFGGAFSGNISLSVPASVAAGNITLSIGNASASQAGSVSITSGNTADAAHSGGSVTITSGSNTSSASQSNGGPFSILAGNGSSNSSATGTAGTGGAITITGGTGGVESGTTTAVGGAGSAITLTTGAGGNATGASGTRTGGNSGTLTLATGAAGTGASANGTVGSIVLSPGGSTTVLTANTDGVSFKGTIAVGNATAGNVGEFVSSLVAVGSPVALTTATAANVTSISLTAGDWDVDGNINFSASSATVTGTSGGITATSATVPTDGSEVYSGVQVTLLSETDSVTIPRKRINVNSTTTVYLVGKSTFSAGSVGAFGSINARRVR